MQTGGNGTGNDGYDNNTENAYTGASNRATGALVRRPARQGHARQQKFDKHFTDMLQSRMFKDVVLGDGGVDAQTAANADIAIYSGNYSDYQITAVPFTAGNADGSLVAYKIVDLRDPLAVDANGVLIPTDGTDLVVGVEKLQFADQTISLLNTAPVLDLHAYNTSTANLADNFGTGSWSNSNGSANWAGSWSESGDSGAITTGQIQIDGGGGNGTNELRILDNGDGASIQRTINLTGVSSANLSFDYSENSFDGNNEQVVASFSFDNGVTWHNLATFNGNTGNGGSYSGNLSTLLGPGESFGANGILKFEAFTSNGGNGYIAIDNVNVALTTNTPVNDASYNYSTTFTENGAAVAISAGPGITDDGTVIHSAKIVLTNAKDGDSFNPHNIIGDNIVITTDNSVVGQITLNLTGVDTLAHYQAQIAAITFSNSSNAPDTTARVVNVTVNDGLLDSNLATATITVTAVNDTPNAGNDNIVTNIANANFVVPEWALLANDVDPDGPNLDVTAVSNSNGLDNLSLATNPGSVTLSDTGGAGGSFNYTVSDHAAPTAGTDSANVSVVRDTTGSIDGGNGNDILVGDGGASTFDGNTGDDIVFAGAGNDTIVWNANNPAFGNPNPATDGHDFVDGGSNTAGGDTFVVNGRTGAETFTIYSNTDDWDNNAGNGILSSAAHAGFTGLNANTEIVIARNGSIIAELDNIEEITVNTLNTTANNGNGGPDGGTSNGDTIQIVGNFTGTSLNYSTIHINGGAGDDTVDISGLSSDHRIVFHGGSGSNQVIGTLRPQDVVDNGAPPPQGGDPGSNPLPSGDDDDDQDSGTHGQNAGGGTPAADPVHTVLGTADADVVVGGSGDDVLSGLGGDDLIIGNDGADTIKGGGGDDLIKSGAGDDVVFGNSGDDDVFGGAGRDLLLGDDGNDRIFGDAGDDTLEGGAGKDVVYAGTGDDHILATSDDGDDIYWGEDGSDTLDYAAISADITANLGSGPLSHGSVDSTQGGHDTVFGFENFIGGSGNDTIIANNSVNILDGGAGHDTFVFGSAAAANGDVIRDFQPGDSIDLSGIDANTGSAGNQSFVLFAGTGFTAAGQVIVTHETRDGVDHTMVAGNTNGDAAADFTLDLVGNHNVNQADLHGVN